MYQRIILFSIMLACTVALAAAQTRRRTPAAKAPTQSQAPRGSAAKYSSFLHSSDKHKRLTCNSCHKIPTVWTAKRDFPDVADFPDHDACVRCHRQQFFTRQAFAGSGPSICTVCHLKAAPREDARFVFGKPNSANQTAKPKDERQFTIEFPHDKHQNVIASLCTMDDRVHFVSVTFTTTQDKPKVNYNNCTICHLTDSSVKRDISDVALIPPGPPQRFTPPPGTFKTMPHAHDACFDCHWKSLKPTGDDCGACHKLSSTFVATNWPQRKSAKFNHEGGGSGQEHLLECTTCHINITRAATLRGLSPDVPIAACVTCHKDNKKTTYPKIISIEDELAQFKKTNECAYCHTSDVGKKKPPANHDLAAQ